ncbi:oxygen-dependent protoporphyrinogen oxidase [Rhizina undulata]
MLKPSSNEHLISSVLRALYYSRSCSPFRVQPLRYSSTTSADSNPKSVAVIGGGITGLSAAWYLTKFAPSVSVTLYEKSSRLGGWLNSKQVESEHGTILFEQGPRTLRPWTIAGLVTIDMIRQLNLEDQLVIIPKASNAAKNRFIYYPDRLNQLPNDVLSVILSVNLPVMKGILGGVLIEPFRKPRPKDLTDESVGSFLARRFNRNLSDNVVSAVMHGIYAGDVDQLSAKSLLPTLWRDEGIHGNIIKGMVRNNLELLDDQITRAELHKDNLEIFSRIKDASVYSFKRGIESLSLALKKQLEGNPQVTIKTGSGVEGIEYDATQGQPLQIRVDGTRVSHSHAISTLFAPDLNSLLPREAQSSALASVEAVTVLVVNLYFTTPNLLPVKGFGYLIPKSVPIEHNPERALGVVFDSDAAPEKTTENLGGEAGTKVTVMLGGHWWKGMDQYPDEKESMKMARSVLERHLKVTEAPAITNVTLQRNCIPQYTVGHEDRMKSAHSDLLEEFDGRLSVAGSSYKGVGLNDCIRNARDVVGTMVKGFSVGENFTGLESFEQGKKWVKKIGPK